MATQTQTVTVTSRSRNIGFSWTNQPVQTRSGLVIADPAQYAPDFVGTPRQVAEEYRRVARNNSGNDWRAAWYIGGRLVVDEDDGSLGGLYLCDYLCEVRNATADVEVEA